MASSRTVRPYAFEQFTAVRRYMPVIAFSPDGSEVAYSTNITGQFNLWRQASTGGYPCQLTFYTDQTVRQVDWSPDGQTILYTADRQGDEFNQLYLIHARGGLPEQITAEPGVQYYIPDSARAWSPDGQLIAYAGNDREPSDQDLLFRDMQSGEVRRVPSEGRYLWPVAWSPDGTYLIALDMKTLIDVDTYLIALKDGAAHNLTAHEGEGKYWAGPWAADGSGFYLLTDEGREFTGLALYNLGSGRRDWVETPEWDVEYVDASADGRYLAWVVNEDGYSRLYVRDLETGRQVNIPGLPDGVIAHIRLSSTGGKLGVVLMRPDHATEIFVVDIPAGKATQITYSMLGGIDEADLIRPELVRYPTHDGRRVPAFLYRPRGEGPFPVILSVHGGPEWQERPAYQYSGMYQYWTSLGIGVLAPNIRGSTGYGKTYQKLIHHDWGGGELKDLEAAVHYLRTLGWVDPGRIGVFGASFGGFATLSCVSRLPDYWAAAVDIVGPSNLVTLINTGPPTWRRMDVLEIGDPDSEAEFLISRSPVSYVDGIRTPLFIIQGAKDPRVPKAESDQVVNKLRARGVDVRYDVYEDEGHGFTRRENELKAWRDASEFFVRYLHPALG